MKSIAIVCTPVVAFISSFALIACGLAARRGSMFILLLGLGLILLVCACAVTVHVLARPVDFRSLYIFARQGVLATLCASVLLYMREWLEYAWSFKGF